MLLFDGYDTQGRIYTFFSKGAYNHQRFPMASWMASFTCQTINGITIFSVIV